MAQLDTAEPMSIPPECSFELGRFTATVYYRVLTTDRADGPIGVCQAVGLPALFDPYVWGNDSDPYMLLREYDPQLLVDAATCTWKVGCKYSTPERKPGRDGTGGGTGKETPGEYQNPLLELPTAKFSSTGKEALLQQVYDPITGSLMPATASNGQVYDPPPKTQEHWGVLTIIRNEPVTANHPYLSWLYTDAVNSDTFWGLPPGSWKCKEINAENQNRQLPNGVTVSFLRVTYTFELNPNGWDIFIVDSGTYYLQPDPRGPNWPMQAIDFKTNTGQVTEGPLNGRGGALQDKLPFTVITSGPQLGYIQLAPSRPPTTYANGDQVQVSNIGGALPAPLQPNSTYWVCNTQPGGTVFQLAASNPNIKILGITNFADIPVQVICSQPHGLTTGQLVVINGAHAVNLADDFYTINGPWIVSVINPTDFNVIAPVFGAGGPKLQGTGDPDGDYFSGGLVAIPLTLLGGTPTSYIWAPPVYNRIRNFQRLAYGPLSLPNSFAECQ